MTNPQEEDPREAGATRAALDEFDLAPFAAGVREEALAAGRTWLSVWVEEDGVCFEDIFTGVRISEAEVARRQAARGH